MSDIEEKSAHASAEKQSINLETGTPKEHIVADPRCLPFNSITSVKLTSAEDTDSTHMISTVCRGGSKSVIFKCEAFLSFFLGAELNRRDVGLLYVQ